MSFLGSMAYGFLEWLDYWTGVWGIRAVQWIQYTAQWAGRWATKARLLYDDMWARLSWLVEDYARVAVDWSGAWANRARELFGWRYRNINELMVNLFDKIFVVTGDWWSHLKTLSKDWWFWEREWFQFSGPVLIPLFEDHKTKIVFGLTEGWPKVWWFINDRWVTLFGTIEGHIEGWQTFVDDPAQALWDWVEPKLQGLGAGWLVKLW